MNRNMPGLPVHHQLPEFTQTHVHRVGDAISSSVVTFSSCPQSLPWSGSFPMSQLFISGGQSIGSFSFSISPSNEQPGLISFRMDWLDLLAVEGTLTFLKGQEQQAVLWEGDKNRRTTRSFSLLSEPARSSLSTSIWGSTPSASPHWPLCPASQYLGWC